MPRSLATGLRYLAGMRLASTITSGTSGPVLLLHGLTQTKSFWNPVIARLPGVEVHAVDGRGHGETGGAQDADFSVAACAGDIAEYCAAHELTGVTLVGHSWGAAVVLAAAPSVSCHGVVAIDGGFVRMADLGDRDTVRERLLPPALHITAEELHAALSGGALAEYWSDELESALMPSFTTDEDGLIVSTIGYQRHLAVLDGLLDHEPSFGDIPVPAWIVACEPVRIDSASEYARGDWQRAREIGLSRAAQELMDPRIVRLMGAIHDVPLTWPDLVAGIIRTAAT